MMEAAESPPWSSLQPELLGLILKRLPSLADRVRLRAVCRPWCSNSLLHSLPRPFPWLTLLDGTFLSFPGGEIHRMPVPEDACCHSAIDNWLFLMHNDGACSLMNRFSETKLELPNLSAVWHCLIQFPHSELNPRFYKLVAPSPLDSSPDPLVAALIMDSVDCATLCISQPPIATDSFRDNKEPLCDVAFFNEKLYGLSMIGKLFILEFGKELGSKPKISSIECIIDSWDYLRGAPEPLSREEMYLNMQYLVKCGDRLVMVKRWIDPMFCWESDDVFEHSQTAALEVFEADLCANPGRWRKVSGLGGHALFVGKHCSKSLPAGECSGYQEDCIYFMCDYPRPEVSADPLRDSGVYNMRTGTITPLFSGTAEVLPRRVGHCRPTWFFPADAI